ncbi:MAG: CRISPR-associated endoribonuclease Cas6 [Ruminococcus sp.]|nr:CRISPR-associated endoribonuclease Cas6 [Ruminococcus sp.]
MLSLIKFKLHTGENDFSLNMASLFHGYLSKTIDPDYANSMHMTGLHPYSQCITQECDSYYWTVTTLNKEAFQSIIKPLKDIKKVVLTKKELEIPIECIEEKQITYAQLFEQNYFNTQSSNYIKLLFESPTSFKADGKYINMPSSSRILASLVRKYDAFSSSTQISDKMLEEHILNNTDISSYSLRSCSFALEGVKIPSFKGSLTIRTFGSKTFSCFVNMLADFAEYSGCGIKTGIGMGKTKHIKREVDTVE